MLMSRSHEHPDMNRTDAGGRMIATWLVVQASQCQRQVYSAASEIGESGRSRWCSRHADDVVRSWKCWTASHSGGAV